MPGSRSCEQKDAEGQTRDRVPASASHAKPLQSEPPRLGRRGRPKTGLPGPMGLPKSVLLSSQPRAHERIRNGEFSYSPHPSGCILGKLHVGE